MDTTTPIDQDGNHYGIRIQEHGHNIGCWYSLIMFVTYVFMAVLVVLVLAVTSHITGHGEVWHYYIANLVRTWLFIS